jgi:hypothetical protein
MGIKLDGLICLSVPRYLLTSTNIQATSTSLQSSASSLQWPLYLKMMQIGHDGYQTQWFDLFKCSKLFVDLTQPPGNLSQPPALSLQPPVASIFKDAANRLSWVSNLMV